MQETCCICGKVTNGEKPISTITGRLDKSTSILTMCIEPCFKKTYHLKRPSPTNIFLKGGSKR